MEYLFKIIMALIEQAHWFAIVLIVHLATKFNYKHVFCKLIDVFELKLDK